MARTASTGGRGGGRRDGGQRSPTPPAGRGTSPRRFVRESWGELRKVQWPTRHQVLQGTLVVAAVTIALAAFVSAVDLAAVQIVDRLNQLLS